MTLPAWSKPWAPLWPLLPALLAVLVYLPALVGGGFVYDDGMIISENRFVQEGSISWLVSKDHYYGQAPDSLGGSMEQSYRPLGTLTHMLECGLFWNGSPRATHAGAFRLTSVYLHALNALLVCALAWRLLGVGRIGALLAGLCFALHPVATEAVVVASFREDLLCVFFLLMGLLCFSVHGRRDGPAGPAWSAAGAACFFAAMLSKEVGLIALPLAACAEWCAPAAGRRAPARSAMRYGMVAAATFVFVLLRFWLFKSAMEETTPYPGGELGTVWSSTWTMLPVMEHYLGLFFAPVTLQADYMIPVRWTLWHPEVFRAACVLVAAVALGVVAARHSGPVRFGLLAALLAIGPVTNVIPIRNICAERYLYVPLAGMAIAAGAVAAWVWTIRPGKRRLLAGLAAGIALVAAVRTVWRIPQWRGNDTIWAHVVGSQVLRTLDERPFPAPLEVRGPFWHPSVEPLSTRGHMAVAGMYDRLGKWALAEGKESQPYFRAELVHCLALIGVPWRVPKPGHEHEPNPPMVEVFSDAQVSTRFISAYRILAEMRWIEYERYAEGERSSAAAQERVRMALAAIERCIKLYETEVEKGDPDFGMYDLRGRCHQALAGNEWRAYWSVRDRAYGAQRDAERFLRLGRRPDALPKFEQAVVYNRRALELSNDPEYRNLLAKSQRAQIDEERWSVATDLGNCLTELEQAEEAKQLYRIAREAADQSRVQGEWKLDNPVAWASIARGISMSQSAGRPGTRHSWKDVPGRPAAETIELALGLFPAPTPAVAADEARRFDALGYTAIGLGQLRRAVGSGKAAAVLDPEEPWTPAVDVVRMAEALGLEPAANDVAAARDAVVQALRDPGPKPFFRSWDRAFRLHAAYKASTKRAAAERAVADLLRARWLATSPWYAEVAATAGHPERRKMALDRWLIEYDLWWWYNSALGMPDRARSHAQAALEAWEARRKEPDVPPATPGQLQQVAELAQAAGR